ncbi:hypothetical protein PROFUN_07035 [Planoprotostelium fungivorum]|uniref:Uncharacterized protein n=1 Tax=Planoprotostelium fungivorum TaxID=1890364 RepID=A0A2P6NMS7_9EUKA|nr:hypothetical protein PROFUN_07035 [Planoprotostelium fungivorum]
MVPTKVVPHPCSSRLNPLRSQSPVHGALRGPTIPGTRGARVSSTALQLLLHRHHVYSSSGLLHFCERTEIELPVNALPASFSQTLRPVHHTLPHTCRLSGNKRTQPSSYRYKNSGGLYARMLHTTISRLFKEIALPPPPLFLRKVPRHANCLPGPFPPISRRRKTQETSEHRFPSIFWHKIGANPNTNSGKDHNHFATLRRRDQRSPVQTDTMPSLLLLEPELLPEFECERRFGRESYSFFNPIEVGDNFVVNVWTRGPLEERDLVWRMDRHHANLGGSHFLRRPIKYAINIYENGTPISVRDYRFSHLPWAIKLQKSWSDEIFSREEIERILVDLKNIDHQ